MAFVRTKIDAICQTVRAINAYTYVVYVRITTRNAQCAWKPAGYVSTWRLHCTVCIMKRSLVAAASASASEQPAKRRKVKHETYQKWVKQYDRECQTVTWLDCDAGIEGGVKLVTKLKCRVCTKFRDRIVGRKNFSDKWVSGADSVRTTNVLDRYC